MTTKGPGLTRILTFLSAIFVSMLSSSHGGCRKQQELSDMISSFQIEQQHTTSKTGGLPDISRNLNFRINCSSNRNANAHKRHFSLDAGMRVSKPSTKKAWYNDGSLDGMPEESLSAANVNSLFDELMGEKLNIKEALEGIDDKTLNGLVQVVETSPGPVTTTSDTNLAAPATSRTAPLLDTHPKGPPDQ